MSFLKTDKIQFRFKFKASIGRGAVVRTTGTLRPLHATGVTGVVFTTRPRGSRRCSSRRACPRARTSASWAWWTTWSKSPRSGAGIRGGRRRDRGGDRGGGSMWPRLLQRVSRAAAFNLGSEDLEITHFITSSSCVARKDSFSSSRAKTPCQEGAFASAVARMKTWLKFPPKALTG